MTQTYIGASITRKEDFRFLTGRATYTDDVKVQHVLHAAIVRSPHAHARLLSIDTGKALELPGVVAVYTHKEAAESLEIRPIPMRMAPLPGIDRFLQYPLAQDKVRYVGEPVAVVIAEDRYLAEDAVDLIEVAYEPLPAITDAYQSLRNETLLHEQNDTNVACDFTMSTGMWSRPSATPSTPVPRSSTSSGIPPTLWRLGAYLPLTIRGVTNWTSGVRPRPLTSTAR